VDELQRKAAAAGFLHALTQSQQTFSDWMKTPKDDHEAIGGLVQRTLGLSQKPTKDDLTAMAQHVSTNLQAQVQQVQAQDANVPKHVGLVLFMQQDS
jgi:hypothetical protein